MHPDAIHIEDEDGLIFGLDKLPKHKHMTLAITLLLSPQMAIRDMSINGGRSVGKTTYKYPQDGDVLLVNHQLG